jgi:hypothetical protein
MKRTGSLPESRVKRVSHRRSDDPSMELVLGSQQVVCIDGSGEHRAFFNGVLLEDHEPARGCQWLLE